MGASWRIWVLFGFMLTMCGYVVCSVVKCWCSLVKCGTVALGAAPCGAVWFSLIRVGAVRCSVSQLWVQCWFVLVGSVLVQCWVQFGAWWFSVVQSGSVGCGVGAVLMQFGTEWVRCG